MNNKFLIIPYVAFYEDLDENGDYSYYAARWAIVPLMKDDPTHDKLVIYDSGEEWVRCPFHICLSINGKMVCKTVNGNVTYDRSNDPSLSYCLPNDSFQQLENCITIFDDNISTSSKMINNEVISIPHSEFKIMNISFDGAYLTVETNLGTFQSAYNEHPSHPRIKNELYYTSPNDVGSIFTTFTFRS